ncbi:MAG: hypothetical protein GXO99_04555, partial [Nitrospirae bacterium]|nr:hypothetical protein [Nitrospirota bacterium]
MGKVEVKVKFETITPLWTGDAWMENREIRPSAILGSLRFWFEVICYFSGIVNEIDFDKNKGRFEKEVKQNEFRDFFKTHGSTFKCKIDALLKQGIPVSAIVFGTTGWGSLIKIKEINYLENYSFGNSLNLPRRICISKNNSEVKEGKECPKKSNEDWSVFYFGIPYFWGSFQANFTVEEEILKSIFYPLLVFMDRYGYWGGKWNMGYGRLKVSEIQRDNKTIDNWKREEL